MKARKVFGQNVRKFRQELELSQEELAHRAGMDRSFIGGVERGEFNISLDNICRLAKVLDVQPYDLMEGISV